MLRVSILISFLVTSRLIIAQEPPLCDTFYTYVDEEVQFEGGTAKFQKWLVEYVPYETIEPFTMSETGRIVILFDINNRGEIVAVTLNSDALSKDVFEDFIEFAPKMEPAKINGIPICSQIRFPLLINLN